MMHALLALTLLLGGNAKARHPNPDEVLTAAQRTEAIRRASVWSPIDIPSLDLKAGPPAKDGFAFDELVTCQYKEKKNPGTSPKFVCETSPGHELKVKYGPRNAEVYGEVLATRLFWALGFAADRMYPVRVRCHDCPEDPLKNPAPVPGSTVEFDPAAVERKLPGRAMETSPDSGWKWSEIDDIGPDAPEGARAQRDAFKLLAAFVQHTDSKAKNQRLLCPAGQEVGKTGCLSPVLMVSDLGLTFGKSAFWIRHMGEHSVSMDDWTGRPVWKDERQCVAHLSKSIAGTLDNPTISEAGRAFLAGLMVQLTDAQLHDLFEGARVSLRSSNPGSAPKKDAEPSSVDAWVDVFKLRRAQIVDRVCPR